MENAKSDLDSIHPIATVLNSQQHKGIIIFTVLPGTEGFHMRPITQLRERLNSIQESHALTITLRTSNRIMAISEDILSLIASCICSAQFDIVVEGCPSDTIDAIQVEIHRAISTLTPVSIAGLIRRL